MEHFRKREGTLAPVTPTFPPEENMMQAFYDEVAAREAVMRKKYGGGEAQPSTRYRTNYEHIRAYE